MNRLLFFLLLLSTASFAQSPKFDWVTQEGNATNDIGRKIRRASNGDIYVTITFQGSTNVGSTSFTQLGSGSAFDIILCKYSANGSLVWTKQIYSSINISTIFNNPAMELDASDNLYLSLNYEGTLNFDGTTYSVSPPYTGTFLAKIASSGSISWAKTVARHQLGNAPVNMVVNNNGDAIFIGAAADTVIINNITYPISSGLRMFYLRYDATGNYVWHRLGELEDIFYTHLRLDANNNLYGIGNFSGSHTFIDNKLINSNGGNDAFLVKFVVGSSSIQCSWALSFGSTSSESVEGLELDVNGNAFVLASLRSNTSIGSINVTAPNNVTALAKFNSSGSCLSATPVIYSQSYRPYSGNDLRRDINGNFYASGYFTSSLIVNSDTISPQGSWDALIVKVDNINYSPTWKKQFGGNGLDEVSAVAYTDNELYCTGRFSGVTTFGSFTKTASGNYDPFIAKLSGCDIPTVNVTYNGNTTLCNGQSLTLNANSVLGAAYQWLKNDVVLPNDTGTSLTVSGGGTYSLDVNLGGVCRDTFGSVTVSVTNINASIQSAQPSICPDGTMQLYTNIPFSSYNWSTGVSTPTVTINQQGSYSVTVTDGSGCLDTATINIGEYTPPPVPTILEGANCQLASSVIQNGYSYKWRLNGNVVGGNSAYLNANQHGSGFYTLEITDQNGCKSNTATPLSITCTVGISELVQTTFSVFPNPNNGTFNVYAQFPENKSAALKIYNLTGQLVFEKALQPVGNAINEEIDLQDIPFGIYQLQFTIDGLQIVRKLIVE